MCCTTTSLGDKIFSASLQSYVPTVVYVWFISDPNILIQCITVNGKTQRHKYEERTHYGYGRQWMESNIIGISEGKRKRNTCNSNNQRQDWRKLSWYEKQMDFPDQKESLTMK